MKRWQIFLIVLTIILAAVTRLYRLSSQPPGLYWEEVALGYDAYSILRTGKDFHGNSWPIVAFESFGDWKPAGYFYATAAVEFFLGLTPLAVRLPSALAGIGLVVVAVLIAQEIFAGHKQKVWLIGGAGLIVALSPWAIQFSRAGFEANLATFFSSLGIWLLLKGRGKHWLWLVAATSLSLSMYTYHSARIFVPLLAAAFGLIFWKSVKSSWQWAVGAGLLGIVLVSPILASLGSPQVSHRFAETSAFTDVEPIIKINQLREAEGNTPLTRLIHHRYWYYSGTFLQNLLTHFDPNYLFITGDSNLRHSTGQVGVFYLIEVVFLVWGVVAIVRKPDRKTVFLLIWWLLALVPAALTKAVPHALRTLVAIPAPQLVIAYGLVELSHTVRRNFKVKPWLWGSIVIGFYGLSAGRYLYDYFGDYARRSATWWQVGYQEMIEYVANHEDQYDRIFISRSQGRPSMYYFFYNQVDPYLVQSEEASAAKDQGERLSFGKVTFGLPQAPMQESSLLVLGAGEERAGKIAYQIKDRTGQAIFTLVSSEQDE
jgi:4-amino-4-deoxy-L-arabinose transferase-like glycosyltransferase